MIFVIDVGNTNIVLGVYKGEELIYHWRLSTNRKATVDEYGISFRQLIDYAKIKISQIEGIIISSVVPPLNPILEGVSNKYFQRTPMMIGPGIKTGLNIRYENPREVGADRIVNAVAAIHMHHEQKPLIVVDFGTATTFDYINEKNEYVGGAIAPGIGISTEALYQKAAKLPRIELVKPSSVIGKNPVTSMQAGIIFGYASQVDGIVNRIKEEYKLDTTVVATGGLSELIASEAKSIQIVNPLLTLQGLRLIYERNKSA
ncbi:type III pantothenate kinase [Longirhabdus pacifica]|uniref:type III pantothenate kinase n=1 Tax=Longirhabdus pacifica TaxID=2305227 RepID=UPI001008BC82|nr:type III pantothenate kinase [Longirhabdus pacifica]